MDMSTPPNWQIMQDSGFNSHIGPIRFARIDEGRWHGELDVAAQHINMGGVCHGGVYMALADVTMGAAAHDAADRHRCATIEFQSHFLAAAKLGQTLVCEARLNRLVSGIVFMECDITAGGRICLKATGIWKYLKARSAPSPAS